MDAKEALNIIGLSKVEADTYLAVISNPNISVGKIAKITHNYRPNIYQALERLKTKGFIYESRGKKSKVFSAFSPELIIKEFKNKEKAVENSVLLLKSMQSSSMFPTQMRIIEGMRGWKNLLNEFLTLGKERVVFGVPKNALEMEAFFKEYHKERAKRKLSLRHIFNYDAKERIKITNKLQYTESKYLPKEFDQPVSTSVCGALVAITVYNGQDVLTFVIDNEIIANAYRKHFELLWKIAKI